MQIEPASCKPDEPLQSTGVKSVSPVLKGREEGSDRTRVEKKVSFEGGIAQADEPAASVGTLESKSKPATNGAALTGTSEVLGKRTHEQMDEEESNEQVSGRYELFSILVILEGTGLP